MLASATLFHFLLFQSYGLSARMSRIKEWRPQWVWLLLHSRADRSCFPPEDSSDSSAATDATLLLACLLWLFVHISMIQGINRLPFEGVRKEFLPSVQIGQVLGFFAFLWIISC
ncbi:unnamed protein product [Protopolystoma xenopodis]|uniref:Uncharacterized protein n=1 Tax=Protopolystoma xenopodis TaxID=117903 RepID=A0A448XNA7_9PLAT|nr:unnamed protein product [Protopolystoma xenopodis]